MSTSALILHAAPAAGFDAPFEMLRACHERVNRMLRLLARLDRHLADAGCDADARQAACDVMRYFDQAGPAHHEDEERHVFPALLAGDDEDLHAVVRQLQQDHHAMVAQWAAVRADLQPVADGTAARADAARSARWSAFAALYRDHIVLEEGRAYPGAEPLCDAAARAAMGAEMAGRRGAA